MCVKYELYYAEMNTRDPLLPTSEIKESGLQNTVFPGHMLTSNSHCRAELQPRHRTPDTRPPDVDPQTQTLLTLCCSHWQWDKYGVSLSDVNSVFSLSVSIRHQTS